MFALFALLGIIGPALGAPANPVSRDISPSILEEFTRFWQYATAAGCRVNHDGTSTGSPVYCDEGHCPLIPQDTNVLHGFEGIEPGDTNGYLALDNTNKLIVLTFRGTISKENGDTDLKFFQVDASSMCEGCVAHEGFYYALGNASELLLPQVESAAAEHPDYKIVLTGHSLGGALATLEAVLLRKAGYIVDLYTYGAPSVGNYELAEFITEQGSGQNYRVTHTNDPVPNVLFKLPFLKYSQSSPEYWITSGNGVPVTPSDIKVIEGINNTAGNLGQKGVDLKPHGWYLGDASPCQEI